jgi:hypothetical protein
MKMRARSRIAGETSASVESFTIGRRGEVADLRALMLDRVEGLRAEELWARVPGSGRPLTTGPGAGLTAGR